MAPSNWLRSLRNTRERFSVRKTRPKRKAIPATKLLLEPLEDRLAPATLTVNTTVDDPTTTALTLRDAITLVNNGGNPASLGQSTMPGGWASQIDTTNPFGTSDTINFNIPTSDHGYTAPTSVNITNVSLSNNVATLTTSAQVPIALGQTVIVAGLSNSVFNGIFQVSAVAPTSFSYALVQPDVASTPATPNGTASNPPRFAIMPQSALPQITTPVIINGFSQPGSSANTMPNQGLGAGDNAVLTIVLDGSQISPPGDGLTICAGSSTVQGLVIQNFGTDIRLTTNGNDQIAGNYLANVTPLKGSILSGRVFEAETNQPILHAEVRFHSEIYPHTASTFQAAYTDAQGRYQFQYAIAPGAIEVVASSRYSGRHRALWERILIKEHPRTEKDFYLPVKEE